MGIAIQEALKMLKESKMFKETKTVKPLLPLLRFLKSDTFINRSKSIFYHGNRHYNIIIFA